MRVTRRWWKPTFTTPTDSTLLGRVRVLIRTMKKITKITGAVGTKLRDRSRSVKFRLLEIDGVARAKARGAINQDKLKRPLRSVLDATSRVVGQAKHFSEEDRPRRQQATHVMKQLALEGCAGNLKRWCARQAGHEADEARIFRGNTRSKDSSSAWFEPSTEVIAKGKAGKAKQFRQDG